MNELKFQFSFGDFEAKATMNEEEYKTIKEFGLDPLRYLLTRFCETIYNDERFKENGFTF